VMCSHSCLTKPSPTDTMNGPKPWENSKVFCTGWAQEVEGMMSLLWPYRGHRLVWVLLAFISGEHLGELFQETGALC
jgi:hypothetical protein